MVQHQRASAQRCALPQGMQGKPALCECSEIAAFVWKRAHPRLTRRPRSGPELAEAAPVRPTARCHSGSASQAPFGFEGTRYCRAIQPIACAAAGLKCLGWEKLLSLVTFFAAAKKVTAAPHRGNANKPTRSQAFHRSRSKQAPTAQKEQPPQGQKKSLKPPSTTHADR